MTDPQCYLFAGGGTGGHLFPGIAVAQELIAREPNARVVFVGSERELERSIVSRHGFEHRPLPAESLRELIRHPIRFSLRNWAAWRKAKKLIDEVRPSVVIGLGGFASASLVWRATRSRLPVVLLEQNVIPGRTNRWLASSANVICTSFDETAKWLSKHARVLVTGNPVRRDFRDWPTACEQHDTIGPESLSHRELLVLGGSQGADSLNEVVMNAIEILGDALNYWNLALQTGPRQVEAVRHRCRSLGVSAVVEPFFDDMTSRYRSASCVISRAGATTLAELSCCGLPMILVPYPHAADNHQLANALQYEKCGAAFCVEHRSSPEETSIELAASLRRLLMDESLCQKMASAARSASRPDATDRVADEIQRLSHK